MQSCSRLPKNSNQTKHNWRSIIRNVAAQNQIRDNGTLRSPETTEGSCQSACTCKLTLSAYCALFYFLPSAPSPTPARSALCSASRSMYILIWSSELSVFCKLQHGLLSSRQKYSLPAIKRQLLLFCKIKSAYAILTSSRLQSCFAHVRLFYRSILYRSCAAVLCTT